MNERAPFAGSGKWYKGNLHCHSTNSDGGLPPQQVVEFYKQRGYDFLAFTDHQVFTDFSGLADDNFLIIPGIEIAVKHERLPRSEHVCAYRVTSSKPVSKGIKHMQVLPGRLWKKRDDLQNAIDFFRERKLAVSFCHPRWSRTDPETLHSTHNYFAVEIYNHESEYTRHYGHATHHWDLLLQRGRKVLGIACDDAHHYSDARAARGWIAVKSPDLTLEAIMQAVLAGRFYSSTGPEIKEFRIENGEIFVECSPVQSVHFITYSRRGSSMHANNGDTLTSASWKLGGNELYARVECQDRFGKTAWTNPIFYNSDFWKSYNDEDFEFLGY